MNYSESVSVLDTQFRLCGSVCFLAFSCNRFVMICVKIIDMGVILHRGSYFRDPWNVLDAVVVAVAISAVIYM